MRYADDCNIFVKSEMSANRVMKSVTSWLERKLFLKVSATKTKVVKPTNSNFLGFTFWKDSNGWKCKPCKDRKEKLYTKIKEILKKKSGSCRTTFLYIYKSESNCKRMDKLFPHRKYENIHN